MSNEPSESYQEYLVESLKDPEDAIGYLTACFKERGEEGFKKALDNVIKAQKNYILMVDCVTKTAAWKEVKDDS